MAAYTHVMLTGQNTEHIDTAIADFQFHPIKTVYLLHSPNEKKATGYKTKPTFEEMYPIIKCSIIQIQHGYNFDLLDIDAGGYDNEYVEKYFIKNKFDVICMGSIVTHYKWMKWCINTIKKYQPEATVIVGNSVGGSIPEVLFQKTKVDIVVYGEAEVTIKEVFNAIKLNQSFGEIVEPCVEIPHANKGYPATIKGLGIPGIIYRANNNRIVNNGKRKAPVAPIANRRGLKPRKNVTAQSPE